MRELRQDEIYLINRTRARLRKRNPPLDSIPEEIPGGPSIGRRCRSTLVPIPPEDLPQEDTISQIKRMVDHLPENHFCELTEGECPILMTLLISTWARDFLKQMIRDVERRGT